MSEKVIVVDSVEPVELYGVNDHKLNIIKKHFPKLRIVARGYSIKLIGDDTEIERFEKHFNLLSDFYHKNGVLTEHTIERLLGQAGTNIIESMDDTSNDVIVFGNSGLVIKARTPNQKKMVESIDKNDMLFAIGPAGTGKTYTAVALAVRALKNKEIKRIILTRPAVEAGENLGFLPGDLKEKIDPYLRPLYDALDDMIPAEKLKFYIENRTIEIAPLAFMRGRTLDNCFVILDEAQNATDMQLKMFLTRMGPTAKFIVTGDVTQIDLPKKQMSGLFNGLRILEDIKGIDIIYLSGEDVVRHKLVKDILKAYGDIQ